MKKKLNSKIKGIYAIFNNNLGKRPVSLSKVEQMRSNRTGERRRQGMRFLKVYRILDLVVSEK